MTSFFIIVAIPGLWATAVIFAWKWMSASSKLREAEMSKKRLMQLLHSGQEQDRIKYEKLYDELRVERDRALQKLRKIQSIAKESQP